MNYPPTNFQMLKRSRKKPVTGDIFAMQLPDDTFLFGRVMEAEIEDFHRTPWPGAYLIYIYDRLSVTKDPDLSKLTPERLLVAPFFINRMPWSRGYFETIDHRTVLQSDWLRDVSYWDAFLKKYRDQDGLVLPGRVEPCGVWGLGSYRRLDDLISDALGIPRAPDE